MQTTDYTPRRARPLLLVLASISLVVPCLALMQFFGSDPMPYNPTWPAGLSDLVNDKSRFAGSEGPIADWLTYHAGDTDELNDFLKKFAALKDTTLHVLVRRDNYATKMERYDGTDRMKVADWTMHILELYEGRPDEKKFKGRKTFVEISVNPTNQIDLKKLEVPLNLDVAADDEFKDFEKQHNARRKLELEKSKPR